MKYPGAKIVRLKCVRRSLSNWLICFESILAYGPCHNFRPCQWWRVNDKGLDNFKTDSTDSTCHCWKHNSIQNGKIKRIQVSRKQKNILKNPDIGPTIKKNRTQIRPYIRIWIRTISKTGYGFDKNFRIKFIQFLTCMGSKQMWYWNMKMYNELETVILSKMLAEKRNLPA